MAKKTTKPPAKKASKKASNASPFQPRWRRAWGSIVAWTRHLIARTPNNPHRAFRMTKPKLYRPTVADLRSTWGLLKDSWLFITDHKRIILGLGVIYSALSYLLVGGISQVDYVSLKEATLTVIDSGFGAIGNASTLFMAALSGNLQAQPSDVQQFMSAALTLFFWLALVWAARMLSAGKEITIRDALYNSGTPIVPLLATLTVVALQLAPAAIGVFGYSTVLTGGWLDGGVESMMWAAAAALLVLMSLYFVVSSVIALIIVALPGTYPWQALREARALVMGRRRGVVLRVLLLVAVVLIAWGIVLIPVFLLDNWLRFDWLPLVPVTVQLLMGLTLVYTSLYIYKLYRSLL